MLQHPEGYPPASLVMLYPLLGWDTFDQARWVWAITTVCAFAVIVVVAIRALDARNLPERIALTVLFLAVNGSSVTLGNGQPTLHILAVLFFRWFVGREKSHPDEVRNGNATLQTAVSV